MQLNKTKLNISVALAVLCDLGGKVFNIRAHWYSSVAQSSLFSDNSAISRNLFMRNEPNFNESEFTASPCGSGAYNDSQTKTKNGTNPNEPNFFTTSNPNFNTELFRESLGLQKNLFMQSKPNFKNQENTASTCKRETYPNLHQQTNQKSKPNPNPIQTQSKPKANPKQTQSKPKANFLEKTLLQDSARQKYTHWILLACFGAMLVVYFHRIQILMRF